MTGPPPTPTAILEARGSWRAKVRSDEPKPQGVAPDPPENLDGEALAEWNRQVPEMVRLGISARIDRAALVCFCESWAEFCAACRTVEQDGRTFTDAKGVIRIHPSVKIKNEAAGRILHFAAQFGFTPAARARLKAEPPPTAVDPMEILLSSSEN